MNRKDALWFLLAGLVAVLVAKLMIYNLEHAQEWF